VPARVWYEADEGRSADRLEPLDQRPLLRLPEAAAASDWQFDPIADGSSDRRDEGSASTPGSRRALPAFHGGLPRGAASGSRSCIASSALNGEISQLAARPGTTLSVRLPARTRWCHEHGRAARRPGDRPARRASVSSTTSDRCGSCGRSLRREGYEVLLAENGRAGSILLEARAVDILISTSRCRF